MSPFSREEVKSAVDSFTEANVKAEEQRDWGPLADFYTDDAVYSYVGLAAGGLVEARGKEQIRKIVMGRDMKDYTGWTFPFEWVAIDGDRVITRWWNRAPGARSDGSFLQCPGVSILEYAGGGKFRSQFDLFDRLSVKEVKDESADLAKKKKAKAKKDKPKKEKAKKEKGKKKDAAKAAAPAPSPSQGEEPKEKGKKKKEGGKKGKDKGK